MDYNTLAARAARELGVDPATPPYSTVAFAIADPVTGIRGAKHVTLDYPASGALLVRPGMSMLTKGGVGVMTLPDPTARENGTEMTIMSTTAQAHTVTNTTGFGAGGGSLDVATFGGAIGDNMVIVAFGGKWYVKSTRNVTLG